MKARKILAAMMAFCVTASTMPVISQAADTMDAVSFTFSEEGIAVDQEAEGFEIDGTTLKITDSGSYKISGSCSNGNIVVKKSVTDVVLILDNITLTSEVTAPICCNKNTGVEIIAKENTINTLSDTTENANSENEDAESAVIKAKSGSSLKLDGTGILNINGVAKNGIKGAAETTVTVDELTLNVTAVNNGIASDDKVIIDGGIIGVSAGNEGIKSEPENTVDETTGEVTLEDTVSEGVITINNGTVVVEASGDGVQAYNDMTINAGTVKVTALGDGIQATNLTINNGSFDITTNGGYTTTLNDSSDSCKGLKAASTIIVKDGQFNINSADDAIHTNEYVYLLGGTFDIKTGDDGVHADTSLFVGEENAENEKLNINVLSSYEGLEAGTVYCYSGNVNVVASDDGINAAGGSSNGSDMGNGFNNQFNPGGGGRPGFGGQPGYGSTSQSSTGDYSINIYGGNIYVNSNGDGLDSNGAINISDGVVVVFGAAAGSDNSPYDCETQFNITGGTVFGAGSSQMAVTPTSSQKYVTSRTSVTEGKNIVVSDSSSTILFVTEAVKNVNYVVYSSDELVSGETYNIWATSEAVGTPTSVPTSTPTEEPTATPTEEPTTVPTEEPTATPTEEPTTVPTEEPTATPTEEPTTTPTVEPTATPTEEPTTTPTEEPTTTPTVEPTATPTVEPTTVPTEEPTATPTEEPTATPTVEPTTVPTEEPTATPTVEPTTTPTVEPTATPTVEPTTVPTEEPTTVPTEEPTTIPTEEPTTVPTEEPTTVPTEEPTTVPTTEPTAVPTIDPTANSTVTPTKALTVTPAATSAATTTPTIEPTTAPTTTPENVAKINMKVTSKNSTTLTIKWDKVAGADYYEIYRAASKKGTYTKVKTIKNAATTSYTNKKLKCGKTYYYIVKSYKTMDGKKVCIGESEATGAKVIPAKTAIKTIKLQQNKVTIKWKKVSGVSGYEVYRAASKNGKYKKVATMKTASKTTYINENLQTGTKYYYKIRTYKKVNGKKVYGNYSSIKSIKVK